MSKISGGRRPLFTAPCEPRAKPCGWRQPARSEQQPCKQTFASRTRCVEHMTKTPISLVRMLKQTECVAWLQILSITCCITCCITCIECIATGGIGVAYMCWYLSQQTWYLPKIAGVVLFRQPENLPLEMDTLDRPHPQPHGALRSTGFISMFPIEIIPKDQFGLVQK